jgi:hypothetical protein
MLDKSLEDEHVHDRRRAVETSPLVCYMYIDYCYERHKRSGIGNQF